MPDDRPNSTSAPTEYIPTPPLRKPPSKTPLFQATNAARYGRQDLIRQIQALTGRELICYVAGDGAQITREDTLGMVDLLHNVPPNTPVDLLLQSPGGDIDAAEKIVTIIRNRAGSGGLRVIVPDYAKSAATLIALGADEIVMSDTSELGVIDPQVELVDANGHKAIFSAQSYLDAYETHSLALRENPNDPVAALMLGKMDAATVRKLERITTRSKSIATDLLGQAMLDKDQAETVASSLIDTKRWHSHGQMISHEMAAHLGLAVTYMPHDDDLWGQFWQLYCHQRYSTGDRLKLFESSYSSVTIT